MAVLDLVDLNDNLTKPDPSEGLRRNLTTQGIFQVTPGVAMTKKLAEFGVVSGQPCNNSQCSFDAGGYLQVDFLLYGTYSLLDRNRRAVTLKLLYVPEGHIAWTWAGELPGGVEEGVWNVPAADLAGAVREGRLALKQPQEHKSVALLDMSENFYLAHVFSERLSTHVHGLSNYEPISPSEQTELLSALGINKYSVAPSQENMIGIGERLGASGLIYARIYRDGGSYLCRLAMYDIERKTTVLEFPPRPTEDFGRILEYENSFFSTLSVKEQERAKAEERASAPVVKVEEKSNKAMWIALGLLGIGGALIAVWVAVL